MPKHDPWDWRDFEERLYDELRRALVELGKAERGKSFYAVALYHLYRELDGLLSLPMLGAALEEASEPSEEGSFWDERFNPHAWSHAEVDLRHEPALALERALTAEACRGTVQHWRRTEKRYGPLLIRVARRLRNEAPDLLATTDDFVLFVHDAEGGPELARKTIPKSRFEALFPKTTAGAREKSAVEAQSPDDRAAFLVTRFGCYGEGVSSEEAARQLVALGPVAVPALLGALKGREGWLAAKTLGDIGHATPKVLRALRKRVADGSWPAMALGMLGDHAWLAKRPPGDAIGGLAAPLKAIATRVRRPPLSYAPLERYLDRGGKRAVKAAEADLKPGSSYCDIDRADVDEALRGLTSDHAVIRWHAASLLGDRSLGKAAGKRILAALVERLADADATVRRLAVLSIDDWKAAAKPHRAAVLALAEDRNAMVRKIVAHVSRDW